MTSEEMISRVARIVDGILCRDPDVAAAMFGDEPDRIARALVDAGLLAPSPLREEWGIEWPDGELWHYPDRASADAGAGDGTHDTDGTPVHRWVTEWGPCNE